MSDSKEDESDHDEATPGWDAIDARLKEVYADQEPAHYGTLIKYMMGGPDPLDGVSVYKVMEPVEHYHYVSFGFTELYEKESEDAQHSGYGFELTFRLANDTSQEKPPTWPISVLQNLAKYVFSSGNAFGNNHHLPLNSPIAIGEDTKICCVLFVTDPVLGEIETPHGKVEFLQMVGLCEDEYELIRNGYYNPIKDLVLSQNELAVTDIFRDTLLTDSRRTEILAKDPEINTVETFGTHIDWDEAGESITLKWGATRIPAILQILGKALSPEQPIFIVGEQKGITVFQADANNWESEPPNGLNLTINADTIDEICETLKPARGIYQFNSFANLTIEVVPVDIKDSDGNTSETVG